jgi:hypothetical protein
VHSTEEETEMPHIEIIKTGRKYHDVDSQTASLFVECGLTKYFAPKNTSSTAVASLPKVPTFSVVCNPLKPVSTHWEIVLTTPTGNVSRFDGPQYINATTPAEAEAIRTKIRNAFKAMAWSPSEQKQMLTGPEPSAEIIEQYITARKGDEQARIANAQRIYEAQR